MESIYKNSPELDPTNDLSKSTQQVSVAPTIESQPLTQSHQTTIEQLTEPSQAFEKTTQLDSVSSEQSSEPEIPNFFLSTIHINQRLLSISFCPIFGLDLSENFQLVDRLETL